LRSEGRQRSTWGCTGRDGRRVELGRRRARGHGCRRGEKRTSDWGCEAGDPEAMATAWEMDGRRAHAGGGKGELLAGSTARSLFQRRKLRRRHRGWSGRLRL
jgi:hypothetical protein